MASNPLPPVPEPRWHPTHLLNKTPTTKLQTWSLCVMGSFRKRKKFRILKWIFSVQKIFRRKIINDEIKIVTGDLYWSIKTMLLLRQSWLGPTLVYSFMVLLQQTSELDQITRSDFGIGLHWSGDADQVGDQIESEFSADWEDFSKFFKVHSHI